MTNRPKGLYLLNAGSFELIYGPEEQRDIAGLVDIVAPAQTPESLAQNRSLLADVEVIFGGWGMPVLDPAFLDAAPKLRAIFYGAGSLRGFTTEAFWKRDIIITSAYAANAVPVAEYTLGVILLSLKHFWRLAAKAKLATRRVPVSSTMPGGYRSTIGLISLGMIGRLVRERLRPFDVRVIAYDPFVGVDEAAKLDLQVVSLDQLFRDADVVSLHAPWLKETEGMITGAHVAAMKPGATFINTARGAIVREAEMIAVLQQRPDLTAILDVTYPEPPVLDSPLHVLPNVVLTPHIAGSQGRECNRLGRSVVEEFQRYLAGQPLQWQISAAAAAKLA